MQGKTTLGLLAAVLLTGAYIFLVDRQIPPAEDNPRVFPINPLTTDFIRFEWGDRVLEFLRDGSQWTLTAPATLPADQGELDRIVHTLSQMERGERITRKEREESKLDLSHYGFIPPRGRLMIGSKQNPTTYLLGKDALLGNDLYVKKENAEDMLRVSKQLIELLHTDLENLLDRTLFHGESEEVNRVEIRRPSGYVQVQREGAGKWKVLQPSPGRADQGVVAGLVDTLLNARVEKFVEAASIDAALYGLDNAAIQVTVGRSNDEQEQLKLGTPHPDNPRLVYAMLEGDDSLVAVSTGLVAQLELEADDLLDHRLFAFPVEDIDRLKFKRGDQVLEAALTEEESWRMVSPVQWPADQEWVDQFLKNWASAGVESYLPEPVATDTNQVAVEAEWTIEFGRASGSDKPETVAIDVYPLAETNTLVEVQVHGDVLSGLVARELVEPISMNPLAWKDREALALSRDNIVRVTITRDGRETAVEKQEEGDFLAVGNDAADVDRSVLNNILDRVASLKVQSYLLDAEPDSEALGLKEPGVVLTFGLRGEVGISKSLLIGGTTADGGRYAQIRGQDAVFLLDKETVDPLTRELWKPTTIPSEAPVEPKG